MKISEREAIVLERLIQAMETDIALPVRVGPKAFGSSMPEYLHAEQELYVLEREDLTETGGKRWNERKKAKRLEDRAPSALHPGAHHCDGGGIRLGHRTHC